PDHHRAVPRNHDLLLRPPLRRNALAAPVPRQERPLRRQRAAGGAHKHTVLESPSCARIPAPRPAGSSVPLTTVPQIDPALVLPDWAPRLALSADITFHALPAVLLVLDLLFFSPPWTISALPAIGLSGVIAFSYWLWVELCYHHNGFCPYPLFEALTTPWRLVLFGGSALVMTLSTYSLQWLYATVNGRPMTSGEARARPGDAKRG
ncbi:hypothetical protein LTR16_005387, partial [Cryomyces antarcticus]